MDRRKALKKLGMMPVSSTAFVKTLDEHNQAINALVRGWRDRLKRMVDASPNIDWRKYHSILDDMDAFLNETKLSEGEAGGLTD